MPQLLSEPKSQRRKTELKRKDFNKFREIIYRETGISLDDSKQTLLQSRLQKRLKALEIPTYSKYLDYLLDSDPKRVELQQMINRVTTNKTHFFREEHHFDHLRDVAFSSIIEQAESGNRKKKLRIWSAACSSGEEPYSVAMTIRESFGGLHGWDIRVLASDIDTDILERAKAGVYHLDRVEELDSGRLHQHFLRGTGQNFDQVQVRSELRDMITFKQINFTDDHWPVNAKFDAIFCRNVLIYFDDETQDKLVRRLAKYLQPDGHLFIGHSESLSQTSDVYQRVGPTIFRFTDQVRPSATASPQPAPSPRPAQAVKPEPPPATSRKVSRLIVGDVLASEDPITISTTLGSCVATCLYDEVTQIGGMNHFALPAGEGSARLQSSFGVHAMELLINQILSFGGARHRLKAKVFGGAQISNDVNATRVGIKNVRFIRSFLATEDIPIEAELLGGDSGMQVLFDTDSGRVRLKLLDQAVAIEANEASQKVEKPECDITLF